MRIKLATLQKRDKVHKDLKENKEWKYDDDYDW